MKLSRKLLFDLAAVLLAISLSACRGGAGEVKEPKEYDEVPNASAGGVFYRPREVPAEVQAWVDNAARELFLGQSRLFGDRLYILVTFGPQPSSGYRVAITDVVTGSAEIAVTVEFEVPSPGRPYTEEITYPYDLVFIPASDLPVVFQASGAREYVMTLHGADYLEPVVAGSSPNIKVFEPAIGQSVHGLFTLRGVASVFEGTVNYRLRDKSGRVLVEDFTMAGMGDWYLFQADIRLNGQLEAESPREMMLEVFTYSARDGSETDQVAIPLWYEP